MMPRIMDFQNRHPEITIMLNPTAEVVELVPAVSIWRFVMPTAAGVNQMSKPCWLPIW